MSSQKIIILFLNHNICCGYSKEPSQWDGSFERPKQMLKLMYKTIFTILRWKFCPIWTYAKLTWLRSDICLTPAIFITSFFTNFILSSYWNKSALFSIKVLQACNIPRHSIFSMQNDALTNGRTDGRTLKRNFLNGGYNIIPHTF